jgi:AcrR family transcriptional regulator
LDSTRDQLLDTAEKLFLMRGLDGVSLRSIVKEAGAKNQSALQYHFGGRDGLIEEILNRRMHQVEARRRKLVDEALERNPNPGLREVCSLLVRAPFLLCREDREFRLFIDQFGQKLLSSGHEISLAPETPDFSSLNEMRSFIRGALADLPAEVLNLRTKSANTLVFLSISRRARMGESFRGRRAELFFNNLVDEIAAMLAAPVSPATRAVLGTELT